MEKETLELKIIEIINNKFLSLQDDVLENNEKDKSSKLNDDLFMDSLDRIELCMDLEKELDIMIPDDIVEGWYTMTISEVADSILHLTKP